MASINRSYTVLIFLLSLFYVQRIVCESLEREVAKKALSYTNAYRVKHKLPVLLWDQALADIATTHSKNMGNHTISFSHKDFEKRADQILMHACAVAENLFMSNQEGELAYCAVDGWIHSAGHCKNLLGNYNRCGIGVYKNKQGYWYFTQLFALRS
jgi:uncharacterized protein YkwD